MGFYDEEGNMKPEVMASLKTIPQGAATTIWAATSPLLNNIGGLYCEDVDVAEINHGQTFSAGVKTYSLDETNTKKLWALSQKLIGITFNIS